MVEKSKARLTRANGLHSRVGRGETEVEDGSTDMSQESSSYLDRTQSFSLCWYGATPGKDNEQQPTELIYKFILIA